MKDYSNPKAAEKILKILNHGNEKFTEENIKKLSQLPAVNMCSLRETALKEQKP